ncbi:MAG: DUF3575 domain-containing protein [Bacteroidales bacterium]|nr:DUF3575 domain-containing protein [Candidatus Hennigimonas equi]
MNRRTVFGIALPAMLSLALAFSSPLSAQKLQVSANTLGLLCLGTLNGEVNYAVSQHWSVGMSGKFNPFSYSMSEGDRQFQLRQRSVAAVARWWPWHIYSGWWISGKLQWQEYNMGGFASAQTEEGQRYGGGVTAGYSHMISEHFNVEMGLGVWGGFKQYSVYACPTCGRKLEDGQKGFIMPSDFIVAISYVF